MSCSCWFACACWVSIVCISAIGSIGTAGTLGEVVGGLFIIWGLKAKGEAWLPCNGLLPNGYEPNGESLEWLE